MCQYRISACRSMRAFVDVIYNMQTFKFLSLCMIITVVCGNPIARTRYGKVIGRRRPRLTNFRSDIDFVDEFLGIPYAKPPVGDLRFQPPQPPDAWTGARLCHAHGSVCPQTASVPFLRKADNNNRDEDCLFLNIYSPSEDATRNFMYPVMVFIHGGSYSIGTGNKFDGFVLAHKKIVVVTLNYRLGILGFFTTTKSPIMGNYGLQDQIQALKWLQGNIKFFRGDPRQVTIFGNSAGASSAGLHMVIPQSKGLFHGVIMLSGSPLAPFANYGISSEASIAQFATDTKAKFNCTMSDIQDAIQCLRDVTPNELINHSKKYPEFNLLGFSTLNAMPWVDGKVLPDSPAILFERGRMANVPVIIGTAKDETSGMARSLLNVAGLRQNSSMGELNFDDLRVAIATITKRFGHTEQVCNATLSMYAEKQGNSSRQWNFEQFVQFATDLVFLSPSVRLARMLSRHGVPVYQYLFNYGLKVDVTLSDLEDSNYKGVYHQLELNYVFGSPFTEKVAVVEREREHNNQDKIVSDHMMTLWTNFAKYRTPCDGTQCGMNTTWTQFDLDSGCYLLITSDSIGMKHNLRKKEMDFWIQNAAQQSGVMENRQNSGGRLSCYRTIMRISALLSLILYPFS